MRATTASLDDLGAAAPDGIDSISIRAWPLDFPTDVAVQRCAPYEARADSVMYREVVVEVAHARGWTVHVYDAGAVESQAIAALGEHGEGFLHRPRAVLGPPWTKDHRLALAAAIVAGVGWH